MTALPRSSAGPEHLEDAMLVVGERCQGDCGDTERARALFPQQGEAAVIRRDGHELVDGSGLFVRQWIDDFSQAQGWELAEQRRVEPWHLLVGHGKAYPHFS